MPEAGSSWRDRHYATDTDLVLATYMELNNKERRENRFANQVKPVNTILLSRDSYLDTYTSPSSASSKNSSSFTSPTSSSTSPTSSFTDFTTNFTSPTSGFTESISSFTDSTSQASSPYLDRSHSDSSNSNASFGSEFSQQASLSYPASTSLSLSSNSALELPAPVPQKTSSSLHLERGAGMMPSLSFTKSTDFEVIYCQICDTPFHGHDRRSNQQRHFKYSHGLEAFSSYPCPNCDRSYKRPDARLKHMRLKHQPDLSASISISELEDKSTES